MTVNPLAPSWLVRPADANDLPAAVWPAGARRSGGGELEFAGVPASELVRRHGTPLYVVDEADVRARARGFREAFERECARIGTSVTVYYAAKAFLSAAIAEWMTGEGLSIDVCSAGEFAVARAAGVDPARLGYHGNNKSVAEIDAAVEAGVGAIVADSPIEIERIAAAAEAHGRVQPVRLRVNSGVHAHTHDFLATAHEDQKFGISLGDAPGLVASIRSRASLRFLGLHCHIGSQIFGADGFSESAARLLGLHAELLAGGEIPDLNLGGGFGIAYTTADDPTSVAELARQIADIVASECERLGIHVPHLAFEPGRVIVGPSGVTLYTVGTVKPVTVNVGGTAETAVRTYVSIDGGMSDNARPALYGADYTVRLANRVSGAEPALIRLAGKHCESGDIVVDADYLPGDVTPGDTVAVAATGAYCWSLSSNYNYLGRPPIVAVEGGVTRLIMRGETIDDLLARDPGIGHATRKASPPEPDSGTMPEVSGTMPAGSGTTMAGADASSAGSEASPAGSEASPAGSDASSASADTTSGNAGATSADLGTAAVQPRTAPAQRAS